MLNTHYLHWFHLAWIACVCLGCDARKPWEITVPAHGQITLNGKPISGAQVTLYPVGAEVPSSVRPSATSGSDGKYKLTTHAREDGAPVGQYQVTVVWHPLVDSGTGPVRGDNKLPTRYSKPQTSTLVAAVESPGGSLPPLSLKK